MLLSFTSRIISAIAAFLYPGYASYKTLSQRPASEEELERWLMYWSVLGCIVGVEYIAEWLVSWIPLYSTVKALFLLYLALPQTQGATYVYNVHLRPFFATHEQQIDQAIAEVRARVYRFLQEKARSVWQAVLGALAPTAENAAAAAAQQAPNRAGPTQPPPTVNNPAGGPAQLVSSLWTSYGPSILAGGAALLRQTAAATLPAGGASGSGPAAQGLRATNALNTPPGSIFDGPPSNQDDELEQLSSIPMPVPQPVPPANNPALSSTPSSSSSGSSSGLRERTNSGKFEEIKGGDVEGYEIDDDDFVGGFVPQQPATSSRSSWFGWAQGSSGKDGYERLKND